MPMRPGSDSDAAARVLLIDRDAASLKAMAGNLSECFLAPPLLAKAKSGEAAAELLKSHTYDVVLVDVLSVDDLAASIGEAFARLAKLASGALLIALSSGASVSTAVAAMGAGAHDVVAKPLTGPGLATRIGELARRHGKARALTVDSGLAAAEGDFAGFVGASPQMQVVYEHVGRVGAAYLDNHGWSRDAAAQPANGRPVLPMWQEEQRIIEAAIESFGGNISQAAAALELSPSTIYRKRQAWTDLDGKLGAA